MDHLSEQNLDRLMMRPTECCDERYSIQDKIGLAQDLYANWGDVLLTDPHIKDLLEKLDGSIGASRKVMLDLHIVETCKRCDEEEGGSCCGAGMENKFDTVLLLINLLLGVSLPTHHCRRESCYLLSDRGCLLKVRLVLCVDFLCHKIINALRRDELIRLQQISGDELVTGFMLYDAIKKFMRKSASPNQP
jgi:hypothetical protein